MDITRQDAIKSIKLNLVRVYGFFKDMFSKVLILLQLWEFGDLFTIDFRISFKKEMNKINPKVYFNLQSWCFITLHFTVFIEDTLKRQLL